MAKQKSNTVVLMRHPDKPGCYAIVATEDMPGIADANAKAKEMAAENPGKVYCAAKLWPAILAEEIRQVVFKKADDGSALDDDDQVEDDDDETSEPSVDPNVSEKPADNVPDSKPEKTSEPETSKEITSEVETSKEVTSEVETTESGTEPEFKDSSDEGEKNQDKDGDDNVIDPVAEEASTSPTNDKSQAFSDIFGDE